MNEEIVAAIKAVRDSQREYFRTKKENAVAKHAAKGKMQLCEQKGDERASNISFAELTFATMYLDMRKLQRLWIVEQTLELQIQCKAAEKALDEELYRLLNPTTQMEMEL